MIANHLIIKIVLLQYQQLSTPVALPMRHRKVSNGSHINLQPPQKPIKWTRQDSSSALGSEQTVTNWRTTVAYTSCSFWIRPIWTRNWALTISQVWSLAISLFTMICFIIQMCMICNYNSAPTSLSIGKLSFFRYFATICRSTWFRYWRRLM